jgi:hypothetical protein
MNDIQLSLWRPLTEPEKKRITLERMNSEKYARKVYLEKLRTRARRLCYVNISTRKGLDIPNVVCTDWVRESFNIKTRNKFDRSNNINGAIFRTDYFEFVGWIKSKAHNSHSNRIGLWKIKQ